MNPTILTAPRLTATTLARGPDCLRPPEQIAHAAIGESLNGGAPLTVVESADIKFE